MMYVTGKIQIGIESRVRITVKIKNANIGAIILYKTHSATSFMLIKIIDVIKTGKDIIIDKSKN